jgi:hypothetical protein
LPVRFGPHDQWELLLDVATQQRVPEEPKQVLLRLAAVADDARYVGSIVPIGDGVMTALRIE